MAVINSTPIKQQEKENNDPNSNETVMNSTPAEQLLDWEQAICCLFPDFCELNVLHPFVDEENPVQRGFYGVFFTEDQFNKKRDELKTFFQNYSN